MKKLFLLFAVLTIGLFNSCPTQGATLEQVKKERVQQSLATEEGKQIKKAVDKYSAIYKVDPLLTHAIILTESGYYRFAKSPCGATGLMQLMPATFKARNVGNDIYAIDTNIHAGVKTYAGLIARYKGDIYMATAAYNMGGGALDSYGGKIPSHGKRYVDKVFYHKDFVLNDINL